MKIKSQTDGEMVLQEKAGLVMKIFCVLLIIAGIIFTLSMFNGSNTTNAWIGPVVIVAGVAMILFMSSITIDINKAGNQLAYSSKRIIGSRSFMKQITDIMQVETRKKWEASGIPNQNNGMIRSEQLETQSFIVMKDGSEIAIDHVKRQGSIGLMNMGGGREEAVAKKVADFLGVPFQDVAPPAQTGIKIGGINL